MVDVLGQYSHIKSEINEAVIKVIESGAFINGPAVKSFGANLESYLSCDHVIPCANGTDALQVALMALGLKPGDEVIVPAFTYVATAEVIALLGLSPVMVDVDMDTFNVTSDIVRNAITKKTKAVVPVHLFGQACDMEGIMSVAKEHNIFVVEDAAQSIGADFKWADGRASKSGTIGHIGCTSFYPSKNLGCYGDGGAIFTNDASLGETIRMIANHGQNKRYYHDTVGCNSRLDSIQAAILDIKLKRLDAYCAARIAAADKYDAALKDIDKIQVPFRADYSSHVFHQYTLRVRNGKRDELNEYLNSKGIPNNIYYPVPLYEQEAYKGNTGGVTFLPITDLLCKEVISLPMHTELTDNQINIITDHIRTFFS